MTANRSGRRCLLVALLVGLALLAGCAGAGRAPAQEVADGTWHALVVGAEEASITLDVVEILSGAAAQAARAADGEHVEPGFDAPYIRNRDAQLHTLPVASDVAVEVYDCTSGGCMLVPWRYADLVAGRRLPYGSPGNPFTVTVSDGAVVQIAEVYLA